RLRVKQPSIVELEQSELRGTIQLSTLKRVAAAMDCTLVYALIPNQALDTMVRDRARAVARRRLRSVENSMRLEKQGLPAKDFEARVDALVREMDPRILWDDM